MRSPEEPVDWATTLGAALELSEWFEKQKATGSDALSVSFAMVSTGVQEFVDASAEPEKILDLAAHLRALAKRIENRRLISPFGQPRVDTSSQVPAPYESPVHVSSERAGDDPPRRRNGVVAIK